MPENQNGQAAEPVSGRRGTRSKDGGHWFNISLLFIVSGVVVGTLTLLVGIDPLRDDRLVVAGAYLIAASGAVWTIASTLLIIRLVKDWRATRNRQSR